jgi:hypothetical protein
MADNADADEQVPVDDLTPEEASRIIHSHRKVRYGKDTSQRLPTAMTQLNSEQIFSYHICSELIHFAARLMQPQGPRAGRVVSAKSSVITSSLARTA